MESLPWQGTSLLITTILSFIECTLRFLFNDNVYILLNADSAFSINQLNIASTDCLTLKTVVEIKESTLKEGGLAKKPL